MWPGFSGENVPEIGDLAGEHDRRRRPNPRPAVHIGSIAKRSGPFVDAWAEMFLGQDFSDGGAAKHVH